MPIVTKDHLAMRLQQNWMASHPRIEQLTNSTNNNINIKENLDDSLTSLNWLHNLNMNLGGSSTTPPISPPMRGDPVMREGMKVNPNQVLGTYAAHSHMMSDCRYSGMEMGMPHHLPFDRIDYRTNPYVKPPYSYAALICMAMKESKKTKITLSAIYSWITDNFMYYRMADPSWQVRYIHSYHTKVSE